MRAPVGLASPLGLRVDALRVPLVRSNLLQGAPLTGVSLSVAVQSAPGQGLVGRPATAWHTFKVQSLQWRGWTVSGPLSIGVDGGLPTEGQWWARSSLGEGRVMLSGPLAALRVAADVAVSNQALRLAADLRPFEPWPLASAEVKAQSFDVNVLHPSAPHTALQGTVSVRPRDALPGAPGTRLNAPPGGRPDANRPAPARLSDLLIDLDLQNLSPGPWDTLNVPLRHLKGRLVLPGQASGQDMARTGRQGQADVQLVLPGRAGRADGALQVSGPWSLDDRQATRLLLRLQRLDLKALHGQAPPLMWQGEVRVNGQADDSWQVAASLQGQEVPTEGAARVMTEPATLSLNGNWQPQRWRLDDLSLASAGTSAQLQGVWARRSAMPSDPVWQGQADLRLRSFDPARWVPWPRPPGDTTQRTVLNGQAKVVLQDLGPGSPDRPTPWPARWRGTVFTDVQDSALLGVKLSGTLEGQAGSVWSAKARLAAADNTLSAVLAVPAEGLSAGLNGQTAGLTVDAQLRAPQLQSWQAWAQWAGLQGLTGQMSGDIQWRAPGGGRWSSTGQLQADGVKARRADQALGLQQLQANWALGELAQAGQPWKLDARGTQLSWGGWTLPSLLATVQGQRTDHRIELQAQAVLPERKLSTGQRVREQVRLSGAAQAGWRGTLSAPLWEARVSQLSVQPEAAGSPAWLETSPFELRWARQTQGPAWSVSSARAKVFGAELVLERASGEQRDGLAGTDLAVALQPLKVAEVLSRWQPDAGWGGDLTVAGRLTAVRPPGGAWRIDGQLARQSGDLSLSEPGINGASVQRLGIRDIKLGLSAANGLWQFNHLADGRVLGSVSGNVRVQAGSSSPWPAWTDPLQGDIQVKLDNLRAVSVWAPAGWRLAGQMAASLKVQGTLGDPSVVGTLTGQGIGVANPLLGVQVTQGELRVQLEPHLARIERFEARGGDAGGALSVTGVAQLGESPTAELQLQARQFGLLHRVDRRAVVSGQLQASFTSDALLADGQFTVDEGLVDISQSEAPTVGDDVNVVNRPGQDPEPTVQPPARKLNANIALNLGDRLRLKGRGLDTRLSGNLRLSTPNGRPQLQGRIQALDGTYAAYGQKLLIERGSIAFTGTVDNPRLDILAMRAQSATAAAGDVKVGVQVTGTALEPRVRLYSEPSMSETEKLSWLVLGRAPAGLGGADLGLLQTAAAALLDGEGPSRRDTLVGALGLDELSVRQSDGAVKDTIVSVGKQVSQRWYLGYERSLNATTGTWQAIYRLAQRFTLRAQAGDDNALDLIWSRRWD